MKRSTKEKIRAYIESRGYYGVRIIRNTVVHGIKEGTESKRNRKTNSGGPLYLGTLLSWSKEMVERGVEGPWIFNEICDHSMAFNQKVVEHCSICGATQEIKDEE